MVRKQSIVSLAQPPLKSALLGVSVACLVSLGQTANALSLASTESVTDIRVASLNSVGQNLPQAIALVEQGREFYQAGQFAAAAKTWQQATQTFQAQGDAVNQAMADSLLALAYHQLGQWNQANQAIAESLQLLQAKQPERNAERDRLPVLAQALNIQGQLQLAQGQAQPALTSWQQATAIYTKAGDQAGMTGSLINQAQALQALGLYRQAGKTLNQVEQALQKQPNSTIKAMGLRSLGDTLRVVGSLEQSRQVLQQSLTVAQELKSAVDISAALLNLGNTARAQQDTTAALEFFQQAAAASASPLLQTQAQLNQLSLLVETQQWSAAQALVPQIQTQIAKLPSSRKTVYAQINFAQSLMKLGSRGAEELGSRGERPISTPPSPIPSLSDTAKLLATAIQEARSLKDQRAEAYALGYLGGLYEQTQQWSNAQDLTQQALSLAQAMNTPDIAYRWQWQLGRLLKAQGIRKGRSLLTLKQ